MKTHRFIWHSFALQHCRQLLIQYGNYNRYTAAPVAVPLSLLFSAGQFAVVPAADMAASFQSLSEQQLFYSIAEGDTKAFDEFYRRTNRLMYNQCIKHIKSRTVAEELLQDAYVQLWKSRHLLKDVNYPLAYVFRIVNHLIHKYLTNGNNHRQILDINEHTQVLQTPEKEAACNKYDTKVVMQRVQEAIRQLPTQQQHVFRLNKLEGYSYKEIAALLNISVSAVGAYLVEAQRKIRAAMA